MALDFAQVDQSGRVTGRTVRISPEVHHRLIHRLSSDEFPLLTRLADYYTDVSFRSDELPLLIAELQACKSTLVDSADFTVITEMSALVQDSVREGLVIEAIAD